jgi:hypothetical protein
MSGGKGGSTTSAQEIPDWIKEPSIRNIGRAEQAQQIGYQPYYGLDVAAFNPTQEAAMQMNLDTARAFGMMPQGYQDLTATQGMPQAQNIGGMMGYSSSPLYEQAVAAAAQADPTQAEIYNSLFGNKV